MKKDTLERPSFRSLQVASCRDRVNWKGGRNYRKANLTKGDFAQQSRCAHWSSG